MRAAFPVLAFITTILPVNSLGVSFYNGRGCTQGIIDQSYQSNSNGNPLALSAPRHLYYPSIFVSDLPSPACWAYDGEGCFGNDGAFHLNSGSVDGCFDAASGMEAIRSVCCSIGQGDQEENHDMFEVATTFTA